MDPLTREETLKILSCMAIDLPKTTKLPDDVLEKRLRDALNFAQNRKNLPPLESLNPYTARAWPWPAATGPEAGRTVMFSALRRGNMYEGEANQRAHQAGVVQERTLFEDPFGDLRETMLGIGTVLDMGRRWLVVQDPQAEVCAIMLRVRLSSTFCSSLSSTARSHAARIRRGFLVPRYRARGRCGNTWPRRHTSPIQLL